MRGFGLWLFDSNTLLWSVRSYVIWCYSLLPSANTSGILFAHSQSESGNSVRRSQRWVFEVREVVNAESNAESVATATRTDASRITRRLDITWCGTEALSRWNVEDGTSRMKSVLSAFYILLSGFFLVILSINHQQDWYPNSRSCEALIVFGAGFGELLVKTNFTELQSSTKPGVHCMCVRCQDLLQSVCFNRALLRCHAWSTALARTSGQLRRPNWPKYLGREWYLDANVQCDAIWTLDAKNPRNSGRLRSYPLL